MYNGPESPDHVDKNLMRQAMSKLRTMSAKDSELLFLGVVIMHSSVNASTVGWRCTAHAGFS